MVTMKQSLPWSLESYAKMYLRLMLWNTSLATLPQMTCQVEQANSLRVSGIIPKALTLLVQLVSRDLYACFKYLINPRPDTCLLGVNS